MKYLRIFENFNNQPKTIDELKKRLEDYSIPISEWGSGSAKPLESLLDEIKNEECHLEDKGNYLVRYVEFVGVRIFYKDKDNTTWVLKEDKQVFKDGRTRKRKIDSSVAEKMKFGEDPINASIRGIEEELGVVIDKTQLTNLGDAHYDRGSQSYPGLKTQYKGYRFECIFNQDQYDQRGYIELQKDKSTFFKWERTEEI